MAELAAVCVVHQLLPDRGNGVTAIDKRPVPGRVRVHPLGLHGDVQADRRHHGGEDQAVYAYAEEDAHRFAHDLGREVPPGLFGENLRTRGADVSGAVIGERWAIGDRVVLEVTGPRTPCGTFERRMRVEGWIDRFRAARAPGAYFRVVRAGDVHVGDRVEVLSRPGHGVTVGDWFAGGTPERAAALHGAAAAGEVRLGDGLARAVERELRSRAGI